MAFPNAPAAGAKKPGGDKGLGDMLKTKEGKIVAGAGAALLVVVLALRKGAGQAPADPGFSADQLQTGPDGTLQDRLDQIGFRGGTLEEWIGATTGLAGTVGELNDLLKSQNPLPPTTTTPTALGNLRIGGSGRQGPKGPAVMGVGWDPVPGATRYSVEQILGNQSQWFTVTDTKFLRGGLPAGNKPVHFRVYAEDAAGKRLAQGSIHGRTAR